MQRKAVNKRQALDGGNLQDGMPSVGPSKVLPGRLVSSAGGLQSGIVGLMRPRTDQQCAVRNNAMLLTSVGRRGTDSTPILSRAGGWI